MKRSLLNGLLVVAVLFSSFITSAGARPPAKNNTQSYLVISKTNTLSPYIQKYIQAAGGKVKTTIPQLGVAVVETKDLNFSKKASKIRGVQAVVPNLQVQWIEQQQVEAMLVDLADSPKSSDDDYHFGLQWGLKAIDAPEAWAQGYRGEDVLVAVLDTGFDLDHPDLIENIDLERSKNFVPGELLDYQLPGMFSHGTHVAGIIAAADNNIGIIGVAPKAKLMLVKVLQDDGIGEIAHVLDGMMYAADQKAKVINMSFGVQFDTNGFIYDGKQWVEFPKKEILEYRRLIGRAVSYANSKGALVVAAAGNYNTYIPSGSTIIVLPASAQNVIGVSATNPIGWAPDLLDENLDYFALYSNFGSKLVDVAAPGGDYRSTTKNNCTINKQTKPCGVYDMVISTGYSQDASTPAYYWTVGTSLSAAHTSGSLALLIGKYNGKISTGQATTRLYQSVDDLETVGKDEYTGAGRINAAKLVK
jgi:lantibiotic leader peptide-processing serine protease